MITLNMEFQTIKEYEDFMKALFGLKGTIEVSEKTVEVLPPMPDIGKNDGLRWSSEEDEYVKANFMKKTNAEMAEVLGRSKTAVRVHCYNVLGLKKFSRKSKLKVKDGTVIHLASDGVHFR